MADQNLTTITKIQGSFRLLGRFAKTLYAQGTSSTRAGARRSDLRNNNYTVDTLVPSGRFWPVAALTLIFGLAYTAFSEWLNVTIRASWDYSEWMPVISVLGSRIGVAPLLQWLVVPIAAFAITRGR